MNSNVVELEEARQSRDPKEDNRDDVLAAMWFGIENSKHSKDVDHPELPSTIGNFATHVANIDPRFYLSLLAKSIEAAPEQRQMIAIGLVLLLHSSANCPACCNAPFTICRPFFRSCSGSFSNHSLATRHLAPRASVIHCCGAFFRLKRRTIKCPNR